MWEHSKRSRIRREFTPRIQNLWRSAPRCALDTAKTTYDAWVLFIVVVTWGICIVRLNPMSRRKSICFLTKQDESIEHIADRVAVTIWFTCLTALFLRVAQYQHYLLLSKATPLTSDLARHKPLHGHCTVSDEGRKNITCGHRIP